MTNVLRLPKNEKGRDFIVGDLHGCYDPLQLLLTHISFNPDIDRLFCVGDLVDRGPKSERCLDLILKPYVYSVLGNHEELMFRSVLDLDRESYSIWMGNGGKWAVNLYHDWLLAFQARLQPLRQLFPLVIVVGEGADRFNIVHSEFYSPMGRPLSNEDIDNWTFTPDEIDKMLWGRAIVLLGDLTNQPLQYDMSVTYAGHTPTRAVVRAQCQVFIDTGCCYADRPGTNTDAGLTIVCHQEQRYWTVHPTDNNRITRYDLPPVLR